MNAREYLISAAYYEKGEIDAIYQGIKNKKNYPLYHNSNCLTILDDNYPKAFLLLNKPPLVLFFAGDLSLLEDEMVAIVGSRHPCEYSLLATRRLAATCQKTVVSGLAKGVDACAHRYAEKSIGILGCGIDYYYPYENRGLIEYMKDKQLVISEYPALTKPLAYHFPIRNRLIAALVQSVYVMEIKRNSGTMTTVEAALDLGKDIRVLPFDVFAGASCYNNNLINEGAGVIILK